MDEFKDEFEIKQRELEEKLRSVDDRLLELSIKEEELKSLEKKLNFKKMCQDKKEEKLEEERKQVLEENERINKEEQRLRETRLQIQSQCEENVKETVEKLKQRNSELSDYVRELEKTKLDYEIIKKELESKEKIISQISMQLVDYKSEIERYKRNEEIAATISLKDLNEKRTNLENENESLKKENKFLKLEVEKNKDFKADVEELKDSNAILSNKLHRSRTYIEYLKRVEQAKGTGEDTSNQIFKDIIENEKEAIIKQTKRNYLGDEKFVLGFIDFCADAGFEYDIKTVRGFLASIKSSKFTILKGYSGTGKSSLPELFSSYINGECVVIPVQPNWRTKQDIMGFYNYFTNKFIPTEFTKTLIRAKVNSDKIFLIVLDEMNLARVEYYFSEFNSKLWLSQEKRKIELYEGVSKYEDSVKDYITDNTIDIPENVFFIGTINEDDSVSPISDKIYDRAQVVEFMQLPSLNKVGDLEKIKSNSQSNLCTVFKTFKGNDSEEDIDMSIIEEANKFIEEKFNRVVGYRSLKQIAEFIRVYKSSGGKELDAIDLQLVSKFVPKFKFVYSEEQIDNLKLFEEKIKNKIKNKFKLDEEKINSLQIVRQLNTITKELEA